MHMTRRIFLKKFLIVIARLVLDIIILGGITLGCYFLSNLANFCLNLLSLILTVACVLVLVAKGMANKEIADRLNISIHTVMSHRKNIAHKTGIKSVAGLTVYALLNNLLDASDVNL